MPTPGRDRALLAVHEDGDVRVDVEDELRVVLALDPVDALGRPSPSTRRARARARSGSGPARRRACRARRGLERAERRERRELAGAPGRGRVADRRRRNRRAATQRRAPTPRTSRAWLSRHLDVGRARSDQLAAPAPFGISTASKPARSSCSTSSRLATATSAIASLPAGTSGSSCQHRLDRIVVVADPRAEMQEDLGVEPLERLLELVLVADVDDELELGARAPSSSPARIASASASAGVPRPRQSSGSVVASRMPSIAHVDRRAPSRPAPRPPARRMHPRRGR